MKSLFSATIVLMSLSAPAFATSYGCVTSREVPSVAFEYDDGGKGPGETESVKRWESRDPNTSAFALITALNDREFGVSEKKAKTTNIYKDKQLLGSPLKIIVKKESSSDSLLEVPYVDTGHGMDTRITSRRLVFDGKRVKSVDYSMCGQD